MSTQYSLSGHESFHCRHYWLKKGFDFIQQNRSFRDEDAVVHLGVGKNMVASIRYWLRSFALTDENDSPTELAERLLDSEKGWDPYLEDINTIYLLHYLLTKTQKEYSAYLLFELLRKAKPEFNFTDFKNYADTELKSEQSEKVASTAFQVILRSYIGKGQGPLDEMHSGFLQELNLVKPSPRANDGYTVPDSERSDLHPLVLLACMRMNEPEASTFGFEDLMTKTHSVGKVFALTRDGLYTKLEMLARKKDFGVKCGIEDTAGMKVFHLAYDLDYLDLLEKYYGR